MKASTMLRSAPLFATLAFLAACGSGEAQPNAGSDRGKATPVPAAQPAAPEAGPGTREAVGHAPDVIRGIYLNAYAAGSRKRLHQLLDLADRTEINTFVVDTKDERGPHYDSQVPLARELTTPRENTLHDLKALVDTLHAHKLYAIARIVVFKDPILSKAKPEWSIRRPGGALWMDKKGNTWVSAWDPNVWNYNVQLGEEAARAGFDEVQFDYVRFPEPFPSLPPQIHPRAKGERSDAIVAFLAEAKKRIHPLGVPVAADLFGLSPADADDINIGQQWEAIVSTADHVLPMVYPSHFLPTHLPNVPHPNRMPHETVYKSIGAGELRIQRLKQAGVAHTARVIPWLQAFSAPWVDHNFPYGPQQASDQISAVYQTGLDDWIFWHPGARYEQIAAAFQPRTAPHAQKFEPTRELVSFVDLLDRMGVKAHRGQAAKLASTGR
ncbi:MAG TPA: putative glycoside hydrolase [Longimicrobiales bacterium]|nr:putative glycoside hydrolase [Longimicrobiales bacterium]